MYIVQENKTYFTACQAMANSILVKQDRYRNWKDLETGLALHNSIP